MAICESVVDSEGDAVLTDVHLVKRRLGMKRTGRPLQAEEVVSLEGNLLAKIHPDKVDLGHCYNGYSYEVQYEIPLKEVDAHPWTKGRLRYVPPRQLSGIPIINYLKALFRSHSTF